MSSSSLIPISPPVDAIDELDPEVSADDLPREDVFARAFDQLKPIADSLEAEQVRAANIHPELAYVNAKNGFAAFEPHLPAAREIPGVNIAIIERVPSAALALLGAAHRLNLLVVGKKELPEKLLHGRRLRKVLLSIAEAGAGLNVIPEGPLAHIKKGSSSLDAARDLIELSMLLREYETGLRDYLVIAPSLLVEAAEIGTWLRDAMQPVNAPPKPKSIPNEIKEANDDRNRMWTLLADGYAELSRVAVFLGIDVPSLHSRRGLRRKAEKREG